MLEPPNGEPSSYASRRTNACALLSAQEFGKIVGAAELYLSSRSVLMRLVSRLGKVVHRGFDRIPEEWRAEFTAKIRETLDFAQNASTKWMDDAPGRRAKEVWYGWAALATGVGGGTLGLPSLLAELPVTTGLMLRSIADIGRAHGERLDDPVFRATCIEVFAYGTPIEEDDEEIAFLAARLGAIEAAELISKVAVRYAAALGPKIAAMSVPLTGAVLGAGVNWAYMSFYQSIARVLFTLLPIERQHDPAQVRSCFAAVVRDLREQRAGRQHPDRRTC